MKEGWEVKTLKSIGVVQTGTTPPTKDKLNYGNYIPFIKPAHFNKNGKLDYQDSFLSELGLSKGRFFDANSVLMVCIGATIGKTGFSEIPTSGNQQLNVLTPHDDSNYKFLYYGMISPVFQAEIIKIGTSSQATLPIINKSKWQNLTLPVPSLSEQEEIVEKLDKAFTVIDQAKANIEKNIENAKELFQSKLNQIFSQKGEGWEEKVLEDCLCAQPRNGWSPPAVHHSESGIPVLTLSAVTGFNFLTHKVKYTSVITDVNRHYWVKNGDLLITRSNTPELVGHVAIAKGIEEPTIYPDLIMKMGTDQSVLSTKFAYWQLRSPKLREVIKERASGANPTMKKINQNAVKTLPINIPSLEEQSSISSLLDKLYLETGLILATYQTKLTSLEELKKSLLQKAFAGELT